MRCAVNRNPVALAGALGLVDPVAHGNARDFAVADTGEDFRGARALAKAHDCKAPALDDLGRLHGADLIVEGRPVIREQRHCARREAGQVDFAGPVAQDLEAEHALDRGLGRKGQANSAIVLDPRVGGLSAGALARSTVPAR